MFYVKSDPILEKVKHNSFANWDSIKHSLSSLAEIEYTEVITNKRSYYQQRAKKMEGKLNHVNSCRLSDGLMKLIISIYRNDNFLVAELLSRNQQMCIIFFSRKTRT